MQEMMVIGSKEFRDTATGQEEYIKMNGIDISYLMLGSNVGDREDYLRRSIHYLQRDVGRVATMSSLYESEPWGFDDPRWFLNRAIAVATDLAPLTLLASVLQIEQTLGRVRTHSGYQARTIDIDILFYGNRVVNLPNLVIPHPHIAQRLFVLQPMAELCPDMEHPVLHRTMAELRDCCTDTMQVRPF